MDDNDYWIEFVEETKVMFKTFYLNIFSSADSYNFDFFYDYIEARVMNDINM